MPPQQITSASDASSLLKPERSSKPPPIAYVSMFLMGLLLAATVESTHDLVVESNQREILRQISPDGRVDAVLVRPIIGYSAASPALYIVQKGGIVPAWGAVVQMSRASGLPSLAWKNPQLLEMRFSRGCVESFTNLWHSNDVSSGRFYVEIRLVPTTQFTCLTSDRGAGQAPGAVAR